MMVMTKLILKSGSDLTFMTELINRHTAVSVLHEQLLGEKLFKYVNLSRRIM